MKSLAKWLALSLFCVICFFAVSQKHIVRAVFVDFFDFRNPSANLYIANQLNEGDEAKVIDMMSSARSRITQTYGAATAQPVVIVTTDSDQALQFGIGAAPGTLFSAPWQMYLVLNFEKLRGTDVVAHELMHAELVQRVGYVNQMFEIPTWFDEGVAMQVDYREQYDVARLDEHVIEEVKTLTSPSLFWTDSPAQNIHNYRAAKGAVAQIFRAQGPRVLYPMLERIRRGDSFAVASSLRH